MRMMRNNMYFYGVKKGLTLLLLLVCISIAFSQSRITQPNPVLHYDTRYVTLDDLKLRRVDSSVKSFHRYNITEKQRVPYYNIGNFGTAYYPLIFAYDRDPGFQSGFNSFDLYFLHPEQLRFFTTKTPYTNLDFIFGGKEEIVGGADYSQNINPRANIGFSYHRNNFKGQEANQLSIHNTLSLRHWLQTKNRFYDLKFAFVFNQVKNQENGGWAIDSVFENPIYKRRKSFVPTNLTAALNNWKNQYLLTVQTFNIGPKESYAANDSVTKERIVPKYAIEHTLSYDNRKFIFKDYKEDSAFYKNTFFDTDSTTDITHTWNLSNKILFKNVLNDSSGNKPFYSAGIIYSFIRFEQYSIDKFVHDIQLTGEAGQENDSATFNYKAGFVIDLSPKYIGDLKASAEMRLNFKHTLSVGVDANLSLSSPTQKEEFFISNHFIWFNDFKKIFSAQAGAHFNWQKQLLYAGINDQFIQNYIYYDTTSTPQQLHKAINILQVHLVKDFDFKFLYWGNDFFVQWISDKDIIRLPVFYMKQTFYYKGTWISHKLNAQLGFDIIYNTNFKGNTYQPSLAEFYHQDQETIKFYPILDLFFTLNVKHTNIFLRWEHVDQGLFKQKGIYTAPDYPYLNRAFRVGVIWQFFD